MRAAEEWIVAAVGAAAAMMVKAVRAAGPPVHPLLPPTLGTPTRPLLEITTRCSFMEKAYRRHSTLRS